MTKEEFMQHLKEEASPEKMKEWEIKCKNEIIKHLMIKTKRPKEEIVNAIKNTKKHWTHLHQVVKDKNCGHQYGFFDCLCEGDMSACPHSHAYTDIEWDLNEKTGKIESFRIGAKICEKYKERISEQKQAQEERQHTVEKFY